MTGFSDVFKQSFLEGFQSGNLTAVQIMVTLAVTVLISAYLFLIYYLAGKKTFYNKSFNVSMAMIAVITAAIVLAMQSNIVISLGMVGALSIVRFRTAIKDPMDLMFLFWSISVGIICGAGLYAIAVIVSLLLTVIMVILEKTPLAAPASLLVVNVTGDNAAGKADAILGSVVKYSKICKVKSRSLTPKGLSLLVECKPADGNALLSEIKEMQGVVGVSLMAHDGEVTA